MKKSNLLSNIIYFLFLLSIAFWSILTLLKGLIIFNLFQPLDNLPLKSAYQNLDDPKIAFFITEFSTFIKPLLVISLLAFSFALVLLVIYTIVAKLNIKNNGWIFISLVLLFIILGVKSYLLQFDIKIINYENFAIKQIIDNYRFIVNKIPNFIFAEFLIGVIILYLGIFKPLVKKSENNGSL